jgi:putative heme iron utilization protein
MTNGASARRLLRHCRDGALATHSRRLPGYPYASIVPLMLDRDANPIMLLSQLAEHTRNIEADERVSIVAHAPDDDVQSAPRLTLVGFCRRAADRASLAKRYLRYFPSAARLLDLDFDFFRITATALRYIGGLGSVHWLAPEQIKPPASTLEQIEMSVLEEINADHAQALRDCCCRLHAVTAADVRMVGLDCDGFDARADDKLVRCEFPAPVLDAEGLDAALAALIRGGGS